MRALLDRAVAEGFMKSAHNDMIVMSADPHQLLDALADWQAPVVNKWITPTQGTGS
jgi:predicted Rossmann-fold nucleotide-binding protein